VNDIVSDISVPATITNPSATGLTNKATIAAADGVTMPTLDAKTGTFSGSLTVLEDGRKTTYQGLIVKTTTGTSGYGFSLLPPPPPGTAKSSVPVTFGP
jgi:hypothetical protein